MDIDITEVENGEKLQHFSYDWLAMLLECHGLIRVDVLVQEIGIILSFCHWVKLFTVSLEHRGSHTRYILSYINKLDKCLFNVLKGLIFKTLDKVVGYTVSIRGLVLC